MKIDIKYSLIRSSNLLEQPKMSLNPKTTITINKIAEKIIASAKLADPEQVESFRDAIVIACSEELISSLQRLDHWLHGILSLTPAAVIAAARPDINKIAEKIIASTQFEDADQVESFRNIIVKACTGELIGFVAPSLPPAALFSKDTHAKLARIPREPLIG